MSAEQTPYYQNQAQNPNSGLQHQQANNYYGPTSQMMEQQYVQQNIRPQLYQPRMPPGAMQVPYHLVYPNQMIQQPSYYSTNVRGSNPQLIPGSRLPADGYMPTSQYAQYPAGGIQPNPQIYSFYHYGIPPNFQQQTGPPISANGQGSVPFMAHNMLGTPNSAQVGTQLTQIQYPMDPLHMQTSTSVQIPQTASYGQQNQNLKRERNPLLVLHPVTNQPVSLEKTAPTTNNTSTLASTSAINNDKRPKESNINDSTTSNVKSNEDQSSIQKQSDFRRDFAAQLNDSGNSLTGKPANVSNASHDEPSAATSTTAQTQSSSSRSGSISRPKSPPPSTSTTSTQETVKKQPLDEMEENCSNTTKIDVSDNEKPENKINENQIEEIKRERSDSQQKSSELIENTKTEEKSTSDDAINKRETEKAVPTSKPVTHLSTSDSPECVTPPETPSALTNRSETHSFQIPNQRLRYDRNELIRIRDSSNSLPIPDNLPDLDIIINRRDNQRFSHGGYTGTNSHGRMNPQFNRQISGTNHPSLNRYPNASNMNTQDSRRKQGIYISNEPDFTNRVSNPYKLTEMSKIDASNRVLRDIKAILNKVTPQTYDKLLKQLEALEIDCQERLEGMITIFFSKAVDEPAFSFLYAKLCKQFQKKQVTILSEDGKTVTYFFRQILLTRCQKEFENDYRQEIEYEKRKKEVEEITDEKKQKEESEKLEEDLVKAKRRKLGNIFFIGELFKLQMLTDTIMYDCIDYLLRDKSDEEALECLCRLLRTIGKELDAKANEKAINKQNFERHYRELESIVKEQKTSARIRFMIQDLVELRQASWVARRAEAKPLTIDEIHEEERQKRIQQEREIERERLQRRDQNRTGQNSNNYAGNNQQQYNDGRGTRGSGIRTQSNRNDEERVETRFNVNSVRQLHSNDRRNQGPVTMSLAPQRTWSRGSGVEKKPDEDFSSTGRGKPPAGPVQQLKGKSSSSQGNSNNTLQRQSSRELARENSHRDRENALQALRKTTGGSGVQSPVHGPGNSSMTNSREGSRNVSREQSRNPSRESSVSERASVASFTARTSKTSALDSSTIINQDPSDTTFDEEKTQARVHSLIEEYTENYSDSNDRAVKESIEDLLAFRTSNLDQQAIIVRELFLKVLEAKPRARKAVGHLLDTAVNDEILMTEAFLSGFKMIVEYAPDFAVDIPLIWQYIGEILGAFIGGPTANFHLLKLIFNKIPNEKHAQMFNFVIRYATEFSSQSHLQKLYQLSGLSLDEIVDPAIEKDYQWLTEGDYIGQNKDSFLPRPDPRLVNLFKSCHDTNNSVSDHEILNYINEHMNPKEKFYIRNIVLSYLQACLINREPQKKIQEDIAKKRMSVLTAVIQHKPEAEIQAVYAIQNFVHKLEHPPKMARLLFDIFYDEECVSEDAFFDWLKQPDQSETEGHSVVEISTKDFFNWLQQAETEVEEGEEEGN